MASNPTSNGGKDANKNGVVGGHIDTAKIPDFKSRYKHNQTLDGIQHDPNKMTAPSFKQDYVVMIRKKKYYAISQQSDDLYLQVYQINNFSGISTSHNVSGRPGNCRVTLKGGEKVIMSDTSKAKQNGFKDWSSLKGDWADQIDTPDQLMSDGAKYYWRFAEKADWEPMDEIYVFSKSRYARGVGNDSTKYKFVQIFFGYITRVTKSYTAGSGGLAITIEADDHLKLLDISRLSNRPPLDMKVGGVGVRYDGVGNMIIEDDPKELSNTFQTAFSGAYPHEIVRACALGAGVPAKYLSKRIEPVIRIPFLPQTGGEVAELFSSNSDTRLSYCAQAAAKLNLEFFADETGNIVLKIPSYAVGINRMSYNFEGDKYGAAWIAYNKPQYKTTKTAIKKTKTVSNIKEIWYTIKKGDTLWDISKKYLGKATRWREIWNLNAKRLRSGNPHWIYPGEKILIKSGSSKTEEVVAGYKETTIKIDPLDILRAGQGNLSKNDKFIRIIQPNELMNFSMVDSDEGIFTAVTVQAEYPLIQSAVSGVPPGTTASVQDLALIRQFGYRMGDVGGGTSTPIVMDQDGAAIYAGLLLTRSISMRFSGSLSMIEEPTVRVGDPIRFFSYDEQPFSELYDRTKDPAQTVYYVETVDRSIQPDGVSTMTLGLRAGRNYLQPSIYDNCTELYRYYYEETDMNPTKPKQVTKKANPPARPEETYDKYTVRKGDTLWDISKKYYGKSALWPKIWEANRRDKKKGPISNPRWIYPGQKLKIPPK